MPIFKCKMCGGTLDVQEGMTVCECEYCGSKQTIPNLDDEKKVKLYERANKLRFNNEFDKAYSVYQDIVNDYSDDAEAYWGLLLCKYGIEYVEDPATHNRIPTCHRSSFESIMDDSDFEMVMENADSISRSLYREEAKKIEEIRKGIIEVSSKEEPYDIFICYKETAEDGQRTIDSVLAQDIYTELTNKGYKVFFSRITLEDKLGQEYEPYIFAALNSAKIMLAFGTSYDYYNAVWVKNEWSRFLQLMAKDSSKHLIPCYKNIDAYDMPKEFAKLQAQDLGKVGATQDLLRGIEKILPLNKETESKTQTTTIIQQSSGPNVDSLLKRGYMALEDEDYEMAKRCFDDVLDINPECGEAYLGMFLCSLKKSSLDSIKKSFVDGEVNLDSNIARARKYCQKIDAKFIEWEKLKAERENLEEEKKERIKSLIDNFKELKNKYESMDINTLDEEETFKKRELENSICELNSKLNSELDNIKNKYFNLYKDEVDFIHNSISKNVNSISELKAEKNKLGLFSSKRKKEIDAEITEAESTINSLQSNLKTKLSNKDKEINEKSLSLKDAYKQKVDTLKNEIKSLEIEAKSNVKKRKLDIKNQLEEVKSEVAKIENIGFQIPNSLEIGQVFTSGFYKGEYVNWRVLSKIDDVALIITEDIIDSKPFDKNGKTNNYNESSIIEFLNKDLAVEMLICDPLILLSVDEAKKYFLSNESRKAKGTSWAKKNGLYVSESNSTDCHSNWWLSSPGSYPLPPHAACVGRSGIIFEDGSKVDNASTGVRPAMWVSTK